MIGPPAMRQFRAAERIAGIRTGGRRETGQNQRKNTPGHDNPLQEATATSIVIVSEARLALRRALHNRSRVRDEGRGVQEESVAVADLALRA